LVSGALGLYELRTKNKKGDEKGGLFLCFAGKRKIRLTVAPALRSKALSTRAVHGGELIAEKEMAHGSKPGQVACLYF